MIAQTYETTSSEFFSQQYLNESGEFIHDVNIVFEDDGARLDNQTPTVCLRIFVLALISPQQCSLLRAPNISVTWSPLR